MHSTTTQTTEIQDSSFLPEVAIPAAGSDPDSVIGVAPADPDTVTSIPTADVPLEAGGNCAIDVPVGVVPSLELQAGAGDRRDEPPALQSVRTHR